mmetsp:Transcript_8881/g.16254  ORF Transcript_8881/g.16254 Transcript_8881/m.16254 type:complete len:80 (-) Transcript_8881:326-565(-)
MDDDSGRRESLDFGTSWSVVSANIFRRWFVDRIIYDEALNFWNSAPKFSNAATEKFSAYREETTLVDEPLHFRSSSHVM